MVRESNVRKRIRTSILKRKRSVALGSNECPFSGDSQGWRMAGHCWQETLRCDGMLG